MPWFKNRNIDKDNQMFWKRDVCTALENYREKMSKGTQELHREPDVMEMMWNKNSYIVFLCALLKLKKEIDK